MTTLKARIDALMTEFTDRFVALLRSETPATMDRALQGRKPTRRTSALDGPPPKATSKRSEASRRVAIAYWRNVTPAQRSRIAKKAAATRRRNAERAAVTTS